MVMLAALSRAIGSSDEAMTFWTASATREAPNATATEPWDVLSSLDEQPGRKAANVNTRPGSANPRGCPMKNLLSGRCPEGKLKPNSKTGGPAPGASPGGFARRPCKKDLPQVLPFLPPSV